MGRIGVGKSSLFNAIIKKFDGKEGKELKQGATRDATSYPIEINGVQYNIWDTSALEDCGIKDNEILDNITTQLRQECTHMVYCLRMDTDRIERKDELAIMRLTDCFGPEIWEMSVIALTYANKVEPPPNMDTDDLAPIYFKQRLEQYKHEIITILRKCRMDEHKASEIAVIPTGYHKPTRTRPNPYVLPDRQDWFNPFWKACAEKMTETAIEPLLMSQRDRVKLIQTKDSPEVNSIVTVLLIILYTYFCSSSI